MSRKLWCVPVVEVRSAVKQTDPWTHALAWRDPRATMPSQRPRHRENNLGGSTNGKTEQMTLVHGDQNQKRGLPGGRVWVVVTQVHTSANLRRASHMCKL